MRRGPICKWQLKAVFHLLIRWSKVLSGISTGFPELSRSYRQVAHVLLTHPPLIPQTSIRRFQSASCALLACIRHAASVRPEPRSNSPKKFVCLFLTPQKHLSLKFRLTRLKKHCFLNILFLWHLLSLFSFQGTNVRLSWGNFYTISCWAFNVNTFDEVF